MKKQILALALAMTAASAQAAWKVESFTDEMTDNVTTFALSDNFGAGYRCNGLYFYFDQYIDARDLFGLKKIAVRVDKNKVFTFNGVMFNSDRIVAVSADADGVAELVEEMKAGTKIIYRVDDYNGAPVDGKASLIGFTRAMQQLNCSK